MTNLEENSRKMVNLMMRRMDPNDSYYVEKEDFEVVPLKGTKGMRVVGNCYFPTSYINLKTIKDIKMRPDDIFVCG